MIFICNFLAVHNILLFSDSVSSTFDCGKAIFILDLGELASHSSDTVQSTTFNRKDSSRNEGMSHKQRSNKHRNRKCKMAATSVCRVELILPLKWAVKW